MSIQIESKSGNDKLERVLGSKAFVSGLDAIIDFTRKTGREAGFEVKYLSKSDSFSYPHSICIGDENSMGEEERTKRLNKIESRFVDLFREKYPQFADEIASVDDIIGLDHVAELNSLGYQKATDDEHALWIIPFPGNEGPVETISDRLKTFHVNMDGSVSNSKYTCIDIHTHPGSRICAPSEADLECLNIHRKSIETRSKLNRESAINPTLAIIGSKRIPLMRLYEILLVQEKTEKPLPSTADFGKLSHEISMRKADALAFHGSLAYKILGTETYNIIGAERKEDSTTGQELDDKYKIMYALYNPNEKKVELMGKE